MFTLIMSRSKVNEYAYRDFCQTHIVPQLLALDRSQGIHCLTFNNDVFLTEEICIVFMLKRMTVEIYGEIVFFLKSNPSFLEDDGQRFLIHILIQEWAKSTMDFMKCSVQVVTILPQLAAKFRINFIKAFDRITHRTFFIETSYMDGLLSIGRVFQREARCFCRCDGWVSDRRLKLVRWRSDRKSSLLNGHRRPSHQIRRRRRQIQPSQAEFLMFLSKSTYKCRLV